MANRFLTALFFSILFFGCKKMDREVFLRAPQSNIERAKEQYFKTTPLTNPSVKRVADFILQADKSKNFVEKLLKFDGIAIWEKALIGVASEKSESTITRISNSAINTPYSVGSSTDTLIYIPLVPREGKYVYSFLKAVVNGKTIKWRLYSGRDYDKYKHGSLNENDINAEKLAAVTMLLDHAVFGYTNFIITDKHLFKKERKTLSPIKVTLNPNNNINSLSIPGSTISTKSDTYYWVTSCFSFTENFCPRLRSGQQCAGNSVCDYVLNNYCPLSECGPSTWTECFTKVISLPEGGGGGGTVDNPPSGGGGGGDDGIVGNGDSVDDPCEINSPCGRLGWTSDQALAINLRPKLGVSLSDYSNFLTWVSENPARAVEILDFLEQTSYSELTDAEKTEIAKEHYNNLKNDPEYKIFVETVSSSSMIAQFSMAGLFRELATEIGFKIVKKYLPGYGDWQSIKDALDNANHGDWLGTIGEVINIVKKKVPFLAVIDAIIDTFDFGRLANKAWKAFDKIKTLPSNFINSLTKTLKNKCGGLLDKIEHDNNIQGKIKYDPNDSFNFFKDIANDLGITYTPFTTAGGPGGEFDLPGGVKIKYYPVSTTINPNTGIGYPTIEILTNGVTFYKFRFEL